MRIQIRLLKPSCILLFAFLICGHTAYCQQEFVTNTSLQPAFMHGIFMGVHHKEILATLLLNIPASLVKTTPDSGIPVITIRNVEVTTDPGTTNGDIQNTASIENNVAIPVTERKADPISAISVVAVSKERATAKQTGTTEVNENGNLSDEATFALLDEDIDTLVSRYAEMISVDPQDISNYALYRFIDHWYGAPYRWGGNDHTGIDCSGFSQKLYGKVYGVDIMRTARQQHRSCERIKDFDEANEGDLIFFRIHHLRISHVGIYLANGFFVHASRSKGIMISSLNDKYWRSRYAGCGRIDRENKSSAESDFLQ